MGTNQKARRRKGMESRFRRHKELIKLKKAFTDAGLEVPAITEEAAQYPYEQREQVNLLDVPAQHVRRESPEEKYSRIMRDRRG